MKWWLIEKYLQIKYGVKDMGKVAEYRKAIAALLTTGAAAVAVIFDLHPAWMTPETIAGIASILATLLVYAIPNKPTE